MSKDVYFTWTFAESYKQRGLSLWYAGIKSVHYLS